MTDKAKAEVKADVLGSIMQVRLLRSRWGGKATSETLATEMAEKHNADSKRIYGGVVFLPPELEHEIGSAYSQLGLYWNARTSPWEDGGWRIISSSNYFPLLEGLAEYKAKYEAVADKVASMYDQLKADAMRELNGAWDETKFPASAEELRSKFAVTTLERPIQKVNDMKIEGLSDIANEKMRKNIEAMYEQQIKQASMSAINRVRKLVTDMLDKLTDDKQKGKQYESFQSSVVETIGLIRSLPFTESLVPVLDEVTKTLTASNGKQLRDSPKTRAVVIDNCKKMTDMLANL